MSNVRWLAGGALLGLLTAFASCPSGRRADPGREGDGGATAVAPLPAPVPPPAGPPPPRTVGPGNARSALGYNLDYPGDWSNLMPFLDLMHDARPWQGVCAALDPKCDKQAHLDLDAEGWPRSLRYKDDPKRAYESIETVFSTHERVPDVGARYLVTWEGEGDFSFFGVEPESKDLTAKRITFRFKPGNKFIRIARTDPKGSGAYVRNVRIVREDRAHLLAAGELFNPDALEYLRPFGSLRFMDWMLSNNPEERDARWSERPRLAWHQWPDQLLDPTQPQLGRRIGGYPVEVLVALANKTGADPHFNMPYRATDEWVTGFATYVRDHLASNLRATVEYSNEVWNWSFPQAGYAGAEGKKLWGNDGTAWLQYMGMRAARTCRLWRQVFAGQEHRLRCVIAPQTGWLEVTGASLDCPKWVAMDKARNRPCFKDVDAIAISGYFGRPLGEDENKKAISTWLDAGEGYAIDRAFAFLEHGGVPELKGEDSVDGAIALFRTYKKIADERGLELYVYEGGTHFGSKDPRLQAFLFKVTQDERMRRLYTRLFEAWKEAGGTVFNCWGWIAPGDPWSNAQDVRDRRRTKYQAIVDFVAKHPCWWPRCDKGAR